MTDEADRTYTVVTTAVALAAIREQARFVIEQEQGTQNAAAWLGRVWTCIDDLEFMPLRFNKADGYERVPYVVRRVILANHLILFTVDKEARTVYVVGLRYGGELPRPDDLPTHPERE